MSKRTIIIDGNNFSDLETFYTEIDRVMTKDLGWDTGHNLDAFNDLLRGGFGVFDYGEPIILIWKNNSKSRVDLGVEATRKYYEYRNSEDDEPDEPVSKNEQTLYEIIAEIISRHEHIEFKNEG